MQILGDTSLKTKHYPQPSVMLGVVFLIQFEMKYCVFVQVFQTDFRLSYHQDLSPQASLSLSTDEQHQPKEKWQKRRTMYKVRVMSRTLWIFCSSLNPFKWWNWETAKKTFYISIVDLQIRQINDTKCGIKQEFSEKREQNLRRFSELWKDLSDKSRMSAWKNSNLLAQLTVMKLAIFFRGFLIVMFTFIFWNWGILVSSHNLINLWFSFS